MFLHDDLLACEISTTMTQTLRDSEIIIEMSNTMHLMSKTLTLF